MEKIIILLYLILLLLTVCSKDETYNKAKCDYREYEIKSIKRFSNSNYKLTLKDDSVIEVHPANCIFYNDYLESKGKDEWN